MHPAPTPEIRGSSQNQVAPSILEKVSFFIVDLALFAMVISVLFYKIILRNTPVFSWNIFLLMVALPLLISLVLLLPRFAKFRFSTWVYRQKFAPKIIIIAGFALAFFRTTLQPTLHSPFFQKAELESLDCEIPVNNNGFEILPLFYAQSILPSTFTSLGQSFGTSEHVFTLPYKKGPPTYFIPEVSIELSPEPLPRLVVTGPKTRSSLSSGEIKSCLTGSFFERCPVARNEFFIAHLAEYLADHPGASWQVKWFEVSRKGGTTPGTTPGGAPGTSPGGNNDDLPRGFTIIFDSPREVAAHWVLLLPQNSQQSFTLTINPERRAEGLEWIRKLIARTQTLPALTPGSFYINEAIARIDLKNIENQQDAQLAFRQLSRVQSLLISKISVDGKNLDAYYHLGGTAFLTLKLAHQSLTRSTHVLAPQASEFIERMRKAANVNLHSAVKYARDIRPTDPKTVLLENLLKQSQTL